MAPGQNTFSIIPNAPGAINGDSDTSQSRPNKRPMTTKQAKKAYQKANKGPKLSKAEKRRQELFEQDRIRKEFEKEKNQARAKAARDRKREKEEKERAEKKKKGLPLVDVHPSQDTIAWFVRGSGSGSGRKKQNSVPSLPTVNKNDSDSCNDRNDHASSPDEDEPEPPPKRQRTVSPAPEPALVPVPTDANLDLDADADPDHSPSPTGVIGDSMSAAQTPQGLDIGEVPPPPEVNDFVERCPSPNHSNADIDEPETMESLPDDLFNELIDATISSSKDETTVYNADLGEHPSSNQKTSGDQSSPKPSNNRFQSPTLIDDVSLEQKAEDSASLSSIQRPLQTLSTTKVNSRTSSTPKESTPNQGGKPFPTNTPSRVTPAQAPRKVQPPASISRSFHHPKSSMGPPPVPPKFKSRGNPPSKDPRTPPFLAKQTHTPNSQSIAKPKSKPDESHVHQAIQEQLPPTSTQLFMLGHLDDFFPSPSQEVRELFEQPKLSIGMNNGTTKFRTTYPTRSSPGKNPPTKPMSNMPNLNRPSPTAKSRKPKSTPVQENVFSAHKSNDTLASATHAQSSANSEAFDMPFFSTQDFFLSSQDMKDIEDETTSPLGFNQKDHDFQSINITRCDTNAHSTTSISVPPRKQSKELGLNTGTVSTRDDLGHPDKTTSTLHSKSGTAQASPRPFFASSGREAHYKYVIERSKTTSWEGPPTRQKARKELQHFQMSEDERSTRLLTECIPGNQDGHVIDNSGSGLGPRDSTPRPNTQPKSQSQPRSINQLSGLAGKGPQSQKVEEPVEKRQRQNNSRSSYEEMLEMLKRKETQKQGQQAMPASQETDYGEAGLDDVLCEML
ncbi:hypothetical protein F4805DRAFT_437794 [Annulohypoxylon moriforme]|nr:hypothetical protein F4805DRAFT_437794 [Annulohypoxylon moriforme]